MATGEGKSCGLSKPRCQLLVKPLKTVECSYATSPSLLESAVTRNGLRQGEETEPPSATIRMPKAVVRRIARKPEDVRRIGRVQRVHPLL